MKQKGMNGDEIVPTQGDKFSQQLCATHMN